MLSFKDFMVVDYTPGMPDLVSYQAHKRKRGRIGESVELEEQRLKVGDKVETPQGTVEIKKRDTRAMRGKQDDYEMVLHMKNGKKASMGSHPAPTASAVTNIAKRHFSKGVPSYMAHLNKESVDLEEAKSKGFIGKSDGSSWAVNINGIKGGNQPRNMGWRINNNRIIADFKKDAKRTRVDAKGKATIPAVKKGLKLLGATEYFATWKSDSSSYKDDSVEVWYKSSAMESVDLEENTIDLARDIVKNKGAKKGLDMQTANLILQVYDKVNDANKAKMEKMPPAKLGAAVWKMTGKR